MNQKRNIVKASEQVVGVTVKNNADENIGKIKEVMLEKISGHAVYVVLDSGSFLGVGGKYFALPWNALHYDDKDDCFRVNIDKERLKNAPGFDKDNWPDMADATFRESVDTYYK